MNLLRIFFFVTAFFSCLVFPSGVYAINDPEPVASSVTLHTTCTEKGAEMPNCFTSVATLFNWIETVRKPNGTSPLAVQVSSGTFSVVYGETLQCNPGLGFTGNVAFKGAGRSASILVGSPDAEASLQFTNCTDLSFSDLKITFPGPGAGYLVWNGGGRSTWRSVDVEGIGAAWYDDRACGVQRGQHFWFGSSVSAKFAYVAFTYNAGCDESWFIGSEVAVTGTSPQEANVGGNAVLTASRNGIIHAYGSILRWISPKNGIAAFAWGGGQIHIHGTGIDVLPTQSNAVALKASGTGSVIHATQSSYNLSAPTGKSVTRIQVENGGHIHAPYHWEHIPDSTKMPNFTSVTGADMTTEVVGMDINMLVYNSQCTGSGGPWYNVALRSCR
jgi:hypothetical protein